MTSVFPMPEERVKIKWDEALEILKQGRCVGKYFGDDGVVCAMGAIFKAHSIQEVYAFDQEDHYLLMDEAGRQTLPIIEAEFPGRIDIGQFLYEYYVLTRFNDHPDTTDEDVIRVFEKARANQG